MSWLIFIHRWLGIPFGLLFAMWFATGIVMHFVPFPALTESERIDGLATLNLARVAHSPGDAVLASNVRDVVRVRLFARSDGAVYVVSGAASLKALHAADLSDASVNSADLSFDIAVDHARRRGLDVSRATFAQRADYDQWTVPNGLDPHRPLSRIALNDVLGTELYISSRTGEVVRDTTRSERAWNYVGSVVHWIYPVVLRKDWRLWDAVVWWLSLLAMFAALTGILLGPLKLKIRRKRVVSPYRRWHAWHHWLGLSTMIFLTTWILSGWLSMDHGRLFAEGHVTETEASRLVGTPAWQTLLLTELQRVSPQAKETEWFAFDGQLYRRDRTAGNVGHLFRAGADGKELPREFLAPDEVSAVTRKLADGCKDAFAVAGDDNYAIEPQSPGAPVYRAVCGEIWYHVDGASGAILERLDPSRRAYRWAYSALHTFDLPALIARPRLRTLLIVTLCTLGLAFSVTGVVIGWRRLRHQFRWRAAATRANNPRI